MKLLAGITRHDLLCLLSITVNCFSDAFYSDSKMTVKTRYIFEL